MLSWMRVTCTVPRIRLYLQFGTQNAKMWRKKCSEPLPFGEMRRTSKSTRSKGLNALYGSAIITGWHQLGISGTITAKSWTFKSDCIYVRWSLQKGNLSNGVSLRSDCQHRLWSVKGTICCERMWRHGESTMSIESTWCIRTCQCSTSRKTATAGCWSAVSMLYASPRRKRSLSLWSRHLKETASQLSNHSTRILKERPTRQ